MLFLVNESLPFSHVLRQHLPTHSGLVATRVHLPARECSGVLHFVSPDTSDRLGCLFRWDRGSPEGMRWADAPAERTRVGVGNAEKEDELQA